MISTGAVDTTYDGGGARASADRLPADRRVVGPPRRHVPRACATLAEVSSPFDDAPAAVRVLVPELGDAGPDEARATCGQCPMVAAAAPHPWGFAAETRCCTYHPTMANFAVGRALARDPATAALIRARLADRSGVSAAGIDPPPAHDRRYQLGGADRFGRDHGLRCPFWVGGERSCGVWRDRPATCRTWFCKHDDGLGGAVAWSQLGILGTEAEARVAGLLCARGAPPTGDVDIEAWVAWFGWCAAELDRLAPDDVAALASPGLTARRAELVTLRRRPVRRLGRHLVASVSELLRDGARIWLTGYSTYDAVAAPPTVFAFLARLDGATPWADALAAARAETGDAALDDALVAELHRVGAVRAPDGADDLPFAIDAVAGAAWSHEARRPR